MGLIKESGFIYIPIFDELENGDIIVTMLFSPGLKKNGVIPEENNRFRFMWGVRSSWRCGLYSSG